MTDYSGREKVICRKGYKYVARIINCTKSSNTIMYCANAAGTAIQPYIIYKAEHLCSTWTENGPAVEQNMDGWIQQYLKNGLIRISSRY